MRQMQADMVGLWDDEPVSFSANRIADRPPTRNKVQAATTNLDRWSSNTELDRESRDLNLTSVIQHNTYL